MSDASVVVKLKDEFTAGAKRMTDSNKGFNKSLEETERKAQAYSQRLDGLVRSQSKLQTGLSEAKRELKDAEKAFQATGTAADSAKLEAAHQKYNTIKADLDGVTRATKDTQKALYDLDETGKKQSRGGSGSGGLLSQLGTAGATAMVGQVLSQAAGTYATSLLGEAGGNAVTSALSSAGIGASIGTAIAPGIGTAIGAAIGAGFGLVTAKMDEWKAQDDVYRSTVQDTYNSLQDAMNSSVSNGSSIAGARETTQMSFSTLLGSQSMADQLLGGIKDFANSTPYMYDDLATVSRQLLAYGYDQQEIMTMLSDMGNASSALGAGSGGMSTIAEVLGRMNMGTIENEQLKRLIDLGINPYQMLSDTGNYMAKNGTSMIASGKYSAEEVANIKSMMEYAEKHGPYTAQVIKDMVKDGLIPAQMAAQALADAMGKDYSGSLEKQAQSFEGLKSTLEGLNDELDASTGAGYNDERKKGMQEQIDFLSGQTGTQMQEAYKQIGEFQASLENKQEELKRNAVQSVMNGTITGDWSDGARDQLAKLMSDYDDAKLKDSGAEMGRVISAAQALAQAEYTKTDGYQQQVDANLQLTTDIQAATANSYYTAGYELAQQQTKGYIAGLEAGKNLTIAEQASVLQSAGISGQILPGTSNSNRSTGLTYDQWAAHGDDTYASHAFGLGYVPYDGYRAILHQGERVLTASQAAGGSGGIQIAKLADQIVVREDADVDRIASAFVEKLMAAKLAAAGV